MRDNGTHDFQNGNGWAVCGESCTYSSKQGKDCEVLPIAIVQAVNKGFLWLSFKSYIEKTKTNLKSTITRLKFKELDGI